MTMSDKSASDNTCHLYPPNNLRHSEDDSLRRGLKLRVNLATLSRIGGIEDRSVGGLK